MRAPLRSLRAMNASQAGMLRAINAPQRGAA